MSGSYGSLLSKYNTLYALYLQLQTDISGGGVLQSVLDAGNTAIDVPIDLENSAGTETSQFSNLNIIFEGTDLLKTGLSRDALTLDTNGVNEVLINREKLQLTPTGTANQAILSGSGLSLLDGTHAFSIIPSFLSVNNLATGDTINFNSGALRVERTSSGFPSYSLLQANDIVCVNNTDALNSTQCVISSSGIKNSEVINGTYVDDTSHYNRGDMKLNTTVLGEVNTLNAVGNQIEMISATHSAVYSNAGITTIGSYSINTTDGLKLQGATSTEGQVITANSAGNPVWTDATGGWIGTATSNLDMSNYDITNIANIITTTETNLHGQFTFQLPPHIPDPILANDATPKGYVDSLVGQYAGGFNLFFNYSQTDGTFKSLSQIVSSSTGEIVPTTITTGNNLIAQFITEPIGIDTIPIGLWDALIYGAVDNTAGDTHYYYELWKKTALNTDTLLGTSANSPDVNASPNNNPTSYSMTLTISTAIPLLLTDRLYIILYANKTGGSTTSLSTYFEGNYYSFIQTSLNAGTTLLSSNNTWTGNNAFSLPPTTPNQVGTPTNTDIVNYETITNLIDNVSIEPIVSTANVFLSATSPSFQYPPAEPPLSIINTYQYYGWYFTNSIVGRKIDWYFPPSKNMLVSDILGLYMNFFNITTTNPANLPFISVYTKPTGSGDAIPFFAHSVMTYSLYDGLPIPYNFIPFANTAYCAFMNKSGTQPNPFAYGHTIQNMVISPVAPNPRGSYLATEEVLAISVGSNSVSAINQVNFVMSKVGVCLATGNQEMILNPQNILYPSSSWVGTATSQLNMGAFDISGTRMDSLTTLSLGDVSATTTTLGRSAGITAINGNTIGLNGTTSTTIIAPIINLTGAVKTANVDTASAVVLNLASATASGVNVGRLTQTTDLIGNIKINNSSGTSGQILTSTGASTAPTWQTASAGATLPIYTQAPTFISVGMAGSAYRQVYNNTTFLDVPCPSITASYLITGQLSVNSSGVTTNLFANLGVRTGGGVQTDATLVKSAFNNILMSVSPNTTFSQTNSLAQCSVAPANLFNKLSFSIVYTPSSVNTFSYAIWFGTSGGGSGTIHSLIVRQITA